MYKVIQINTTSLAVCEECETFVAPERLDFFVIPLSPVTVIEKCAGIGACVNITHFAVAISDLIRVTRIMPIDLRVDKTTPP